MTVLRDLDHQFQSTIGNQQHRLIDFGSDQEQDKRHEREAGEDLLPKNYLTCYVFQLNQKNNLNLTITNLKITHTKDCDKLTPYNFLH